MACQAPVGNFVEQMKNMNGNQNANIVPDFTPEHVPGEPFGLRGDEVVSTEKFAEVVTSTLDVDNDIVECIDTNPNNNIVFSAENAPDIPLQRESCNLAIMKQEKVRFSYPMDQFLKICLGQLPVHQMEHIHYHIDSNIYSGFMM